MKYHIVLRPEAEGGFAVTVPALPGCVTWGKTVKQARRMAKNAIEGYLESLAKHGEPIPRDDDVLNTTVDVSPPADAIHFWIRFGVPSRWSLSMTGANPHVYKSSWR